MSWTSVLLGSRAASIVLILEVFLRLQHFPQLFLKTLKNTCLSNAGIQLPFRPEVYAETLTFLRACLVLSSGSLPHLDDLRNPQMYGPKVTVFLAGCSPINPPQTVVADSLEFGERLMRATQGPAQAQFLLQLAGCSPALSFKWFEGKLAWIRGLLANTRLVSIYLQPEK